MPHKTPAIRYWSSDDIRDRDIFEFENGGFGILNLYEKDNDDNDSFENKLKMDKLSQNVDLLERILSDINSEIKICSSKIPDNPRLKEIKAKFNNCIRNEYLSGQDTMNKEEFENDETIGFERESQDLNEEKKKNENENKNSDADGFKNVSKEEVNENEKNNESQSTEGHGSPSKDEEIKQEEYINLKEQYRIEVIQRLRKIEKRSFDFRSFLAEVGMYIAPDDFEIKKAYKQALLTFHPDRVPKDDLHKQVEAEEIFKIIQRMKERKEPNIIII
ncbi:dnaJ domain-containing protein [Artemisia annua]|uniref:DnaJ domain-containing protein n=1 Tax=Artemisia annua TaxID=35608 RepID=A0A2U1LMK8_ARTAN|nr:dnaJ domain-containing protein [Artemisia annua]